ncbi:hypothetical protein C8R46DRAFT_1223170 [Mycena filopes]|nr:hypothetical protein C8R46DRAFT_1223170 [Mycena filopes]
MSGTDIVPTSIMNRLPNELKVDILRRSYLDLAWDPLAFVVLGQLYPLALQSRQLVCRDWNDIVLADKKTWCCVIVHNHMTLPALAKVMELCGTHLPISVHFFVRDPIIKNMPSSFFEPWNTESWTVEAFLRYATPLLATIFHRCTFLSAYSFGRNYSSTFMRYLTNPGYNAPKLQSIQLNLCPVHCTWKPYALPFGGALPSLSSFLTTFLQSNWGAALGNLVTLELASMRALFTAAYRLVNLQLSNFAIQYDDWVSADYSTRTLMPNLTHLDIYFSSELTCAILAMLELPAVTTMRVATEQIAVISSPA